MSTESTYGAVSQSPSATAAPGGHAPSGYTANPANLGVATLPGNAETLTGAAAGAAAGAGMAMISDLPGERQLEGQQAPSIILEKMAPDEIQVDRKATFQTTVRNTGNARLTTWWSSTPYLAAQNSWTPYHRVRVHPTVR